MRWIILPLLWLALAAIADQIPSSWTLQQLMRSLATVTTVSATFREQKDLAILQQPLVMSGILYYRSPDYLKKQTLQPHTESYEADADWLTVDTPTAGHHQFHVRGYPLIQAFVESVRATLAGDLPALERYYQVELQGNAEGWTLRLKPVDREMADFVTAILIGGQNHHVLSIETLEASGDRSLMLIEPHNE